MKKQKYWETKAFKKKQNDMIKRQKKYKRAINICLNSINKNGKTALIYNI